MHRRTFLATTALAAAATILPAQPPAPTPKTRRLRKAVMYGMIAPGNSVLDRFKILRDCGFDGVEMDAPNPRIPRDEVLAAIDATGIKVHGVVNSAHWRDTLTHPAAEVRRRGLDALLAAIRDAHAFGASSVLLVPGVVNKDVPYDAAWTRSQEQIRLALPLAAELNVIIAIENVWNNFLLSPLEAARYVDEFNSPFVRWHFDTGNAVHYGWPEQWIRILGPRTHKLHIKEFSRKKASDEGLWKGFNVDLLEGDNDWPAIMNALDAAAVIPPPPDALWATAEMPGGDEARLRAIAEKMDRIFAL